MDAQNVGSFVSHNSMAKKQKEKIEEVLVEPKKEAPTEKVETVAFSSTLDKTLKDFIGVTAKSKVAIVVPLFGYWKDVEGNQLGVETLKATLDRIYSGVHQTYVLFVGTPERMSNEVQNYIFVSAQAGNSKGVQVEPEASYSEYVKEGIDAALKETDASFIVVVNPWTIIQHGGLDVIVDRVNRAGSAKIVSGYDLRGIISDYEFDNQTYQIPKEERDLNLNFVAITRAYAEMLDLDVGIKTHQYLARDVWQTMYSKGYDVITTQKVPIFSFDIGWRLYETSEALEGDKQYFIRKWGFDPSINND